MSHLFGEETATVHKHGRLVGQHIEHRRFDTKRHGFHVGSHPIHYATAAIEGQRAQKGVDDRRRVLFPWEHANRLIQSGTTIGVLTKDQRPTPTPEAIVQLMTETAAANWRFIDPRYPLYNRPWLGEASCALGVGSQSGWLALCFSRNLTPYLGDRAETGIVMWAPGPQIFCRTDRRCGFPHAKWIGNYGTGYLWKNRGKAFGVDEVLQYDLHGNVAETTGSNIFVVLDDGLVLTPPLDCVLNGINRRRTIQILEALGYQVIVQHITLNHLLEAREIFVTGTWSGIVPVATLLAGWPNVQPLALNQLLSTPGPVTKAVRDVHTAIITYDLDALPQRLTVDPKWWLEF